MNGETTSQATDKPRVLVVSAAGVFLRAVHAAMGNRCLIDLADSPLTAIESLLTADYSHMVIGPGFEKATISSLARHAHNMCPTLDIALEASSESEDAGIDNVRAVTWTGRNVEEFTEQLLEESGTAPQPPAGDAREIAYLTLLDQICEAASSEDSVSGTLLGIADGLAQIEPSSATAVLALDTPSPALHVAAHQPVSEPFVANLREAMLLAARDLSGDERLAEGCQVHVRGNALVHDGVAGFEHLLLVPALSHGTLHGILGLATDTADVDTSMIYRIVYHVSRLVGTVNELRQLVLHDHLTGLYNRRYLETELERAWLLSRRHAHALSFAIIDIDNFKKVNDSYGHPVGDRVLQEVARCIEIASRASDTVARYGGDELAVILPFADHSGATAYAERILRALTHYEFSRTVKALDVTVSIGLVSVGPSMEASCSDLVVTADQALYEAKGDGRAGLRVRQLG